MTSDELVDAVRQRARVEQVTDFEGLPAGPRVAESDAIIIVEGRADVRRLLEVGIKNAVAVEGTDVPDAVAGLTTGRTVTAFLDGDRGGDLILRELQQVGDVDYVAFAPTGQSVEDLDRAEILAALRRKLPSDQVAEGRTPRETFDGSEAAGDAEPETAVTASEDATESESDRAASGATDASDHEISRNGDVIADSTAKAESETAEPEDDRESAPASDDGATAASDSGVTDTAERETTAGAETTASTGETDASAPTEEGAVVQTDRPSEPQTLAGHVEAVVDGNLGTVRLLDEEYSALAEGPADSAFDLLSGAEETPQSVVLDGTLDQRLLDVAAQRGVEQFVAADTDEFVKQPVSVRVRTAADLDVEA